MGENENQGNVWGRSDADRDVFGNSPADAWGNAADRNGWNDVARDSQGSDWFRGATDANSRADSGGGLLEAVVNFFGNLFR